MKYIYIIGLVVCVSTVSVGQINEIGLFAGGTNYVGDVGKTYYVLPNKLAAGIIYKWNMNPRIALRATASYLPIGANDVESDNIIRQNRGYKFENTIKELAVGMEINFYEYDLSSNDQTATPYILLELAAFNYKRVLSQTITGQFLYTDKTSYAIPFGVGYKGKLAGKLAFAVEAKARYTFVDDLDYTTPNFSTLDFGGTGNDWYFFTGISVVYTFGRPACYSKPQY